MPIRKQTNMTPMELRSSEEIICTYLWYNDGSSSYWIFSNIPDREKEKYKDQYKMLLSDLATAGYEITKKDHAPLPHKDKSS